MRQPWSVIGWFPLVLLTACVASQIEAPPGMDRLLSQGDIQVAEQHLKDFGFDPGPVDGLFTAQTEAAVRAFQIRYGLPVSRRLDRATRQELLPGMDDWKNDPD
jgi:peptidoglycan hydrolase-like protein with peptidoglycan-binding domain